MPRGKREPDGIRRKRERRAPKTLEEIEKSRHVNFEDVRTNNNLKRRKKKSKKKLKNIKRKVFMGIGLVIAAILLFVLVSVIGFFGKLDNSDTIEATKPSGNSVNILLLGMDIGDTNQVENKSIKRTDTMMLLNYNKKTKVVQVVSIPRDTLVKENGKNYKINAAYVKGGDEKTKSVVQNLLGITVNYIVKIDYAAFRGFIDAIGGVDMEIERDMKYDDDGQNLHIDFKGGTVAHLDGQKAEEFFRWRKNNDGTGFANGDLDRIENQHKFLQKVVDKCKKPSILFKLPKILTCIAENMSTNMSSANIVSYGMKFMTSKAIEMKTIQGTAKMIQGQSYLVFEKDKNKDLLQSLEDGATTEASINKEDIKILVLNGTKINGLAGRMKTALEVLGWTRIDTGNADPTEKTAIKTDNKEIKKLMQKDLPEATKTDSKPKDEEYSSYDVVIVIGTDYKKLGE